MAIAKKTINKPASKRRVVGGKIMLKTGERKNVTVDQAKMQAAVYLVRNGLDGEILVPTDRKNVFSISEDRFVKVKRAAKTSPPVITIEAADRKGQIEAGTWVALNQPKRHLGKDFTKVESVKKLK
ncbi:MAG: hypothetical protein CFE25_11410 [Chitinophagaceae bacterium BSSC1]|nr:MAG: hypothetical protein CFE25_11410 [Chitinophagaceae bacterium BSSC1]